jgi:hypothetical protein
VLTLGYTCRSDDCGVAYDIEVPRSLSVRVDAAPLHLSANADTGGVTLLMPAAPGYDVTASADVGSVSVTVRRDASSGHVIQARADVGSVTVARN